MRHFLQLIGFSEGAMSCSDEAGNYECRTDRQSGDNRNWDQCVEERYFGYRMHLPVGRHKIPKACATDAEYDNPGYDGNHVKQAFGQAR